MNKKETSIKTRFNEEPKTVWHNSTNNIKVTVTNYPQGDFKRRCFNMIKSTWADTPVDTSMVHNSDIEDTFLELLQFKVLPNSMEHLQFTFLIEGLTLVEVTHLLRHRMFSSIHAQCTGDRFLQKDSVFIPSSIEKSEFAEEYKKLTTATKQLYTKMTNSKQISLLDARYILTRNHRYFYYVSMNLKDAMAFINQRKCTQIQPELDNILAHKIYENIIKVIPELAKVLSLKCGPRCFYITSQGIDNSRVYLPDAEHKKYLKEDVNTVYSKTRKEMGTAFNPQDD